MKEQEDYLGKKFGIYLISEKLERDKYHHQLYLGICQECGYKRIATIYDFKKNITTCSHLNLSIEENRREWYKKNKKQCFFVKKIFL